MYSDHAANRCTAILKGRRCNLNVGHTGKHEALLVNKKNVATTVTWNKPGQYSQ